MAQRKCVLAEDSRAGVKLALTGAYERMDDEWNTCKNARAAFADTEVVRSVRLGEVRQADAL